MKTTCYLRIARNRGSLYGTHPFTFAVSVREPKSPLTDSRGRVLRTATIKLNLELPGSLFGPAAEVDVFVDPTPGLARPVEAS